MPLITPEALKHDNISDEAKRNSDAFEKARSEHEQVGVFRCADSRKRFPLRSVELSSISGGGPRSPYEDVLNDDNIPFFAMVSHDDCGGAKVKKALGELHGFEDAADADFLRKHVWYADPYKQAVVGASFTADRAKKPVLAAIMDHSRVWVHPTGFIDGDLNILPIPLYKTLAPDYFPPALKEQGIPEIDADKLPNLLKKYLIECHRLHFDYAAKYDLGKIQKQQNPSATIISTGFMSPAYRYPGLFDMPGSFFHLSLAQKQDGVIVDLDPRILDNAAKQIKYPQDHFDQNLIIIETRYIAKSTMVAEKLNETAHVERWLKDPSHRIILVETNAGKTTYAEYYK